MFIRRNTHGMTLIEIFLGLILGSMILNNLFEIYLATTKNQMWLVSLNKVQENMRMATQLLTNDIHKAGFSGCLKKNSINLTNHTVLNLDHHIAPYEPIEKKHNTDGISIWYAKTLVSLLSQSMKNKNILVTKKSDVISKRTIMLITDCLTADVIEIEHKESHAGEDKLYLNQPLHKLYDKNSELWVLYQANYFIADTGRKNNDKKPIYSLYQKNRYGEKIEVIEGIDYMKITFFPDTVSLNNRIQSVSIKLRMVSSLTSQVKKQWYLYLGLRNA